MIALSQQSASIPKDSTVPPCGLAYRRPQKRPWSPSGRSRSAVLSDSRLHRASWGEAFPLSEADHRLVIPKSFLHVITALPLWFVE